MGTGVGRGVGTGVGGGVGATVIVIEPASRVVVRPWESAVNVIECDPAGSRSATANRRPCFGVPPIAVIGWIVLPMATRTESGRSALAFR